MLKCNCVEEEKMYGSLKRANGWCEFAMEVYGELLSIIK